MRTLAKVGLVELESASSRTDAALPSIDAELDAELQAVLADDLSHLGATNERRLDASAGSAARDHSAIASGPRDPGAQSGGARLEGSTDILEGRSFDELYREAAVPASPFPVERLIRLIDGLRAMEPQVRRAAVEAMDAADESWTMEDALLDAQRKARALKEAQGGLTAQLSAIDTQAQADLRSLEEYRNKATAEIRKQIEDLEQLLEEELRGIAEKNAGIMARLDSARQAHQRETGRILSEIERIESTARMFSSAQSE